MDDSPRIGALQYLLVLLSLPFAIMFASTLGDVGGRSAIAVAGAVLAFGGLTVACWAGVLWAELYARRRQREEAEERRRRMMAGPPPGTTLHGTLPFDGSVPFDEF